MFKRSLASLALLALVGSAFAHDASVSTTLSASGISTSQANAFSGTAGGSSRSAALDARSITVQGAGGGAAGTVLVTKFANVNASGSVNMAGMSAAQNVSSGSGTGAALASGGVMGSVVASGNGHTVTGGPLVSLSANAEGVSEQSVVTGTNGRGALVVTGSSDFAASATAAQTKIGSFVNDIKLGSTATANAGTATMTQVHTGSAVLSNNNQAAANGLASARVGSMVNSSSN